MVGNRDNKTCAIKILSGAGETYLNLSRNKINWLWGGPDKPLTLTTEPFPIPCLPVARIVYPQSCPMLLARSSGLSFGLVGAQFVHARQTGSHRLVPLSPNAHNGTRQQQSSVCRIGGNRKKKGKRKYAAQKQSLIMLGMKTFVVQNGVEPPRLCRLPARTDYLFGAN